MALFVFLYIHISVWCDFHFNLWIGQELSLKFYERLKTQKLQTRGVSGRVCRGDFPYHGIPFSSYEGLHGAVAQRDRPHGAALTVGHEQAAPGVPRGQGEARRLGKARLVRVCVISVLFVSTASEPEAGSFL